MPFLTLLTGPLGKWIGYAAGAVGLIFAGWFFIHTHDRAVQAELLAGQRAAQVEQLRGQHAATVAALEHEAAAAQLRAAAAESVRRTIASAPSSTGCVGSPAIRAVLDGLRQHAPTPVSAPGGAVKPAQLSGAAGSAAGPP